MLRLFFSRKWWWATLLVIAAILVMLRLALWQLERLEERRAFNARVAAQVEQPPLTLTGDALNLDLTEMEYRAVIVVGEYDHTQEVALRNRVYENHLGINLLTPLIIAGSERAVLVNRGWIPVEQAAPENWKTFAEPGKVEVRGVIRKSQSRPDFGGVPDPPGSLKLWNLVNVARIGEQVSHPLLPIYVQETPDSSRAVAGKGSSAQDVYPIRAKPAIDLSEGPHLGYVGQWLIFAAILAVVYARLVLAR
jgi:surfeit locus 1 family protein